YQFYSVTALPPFLK
ncbi:hypothetical protein EC5412_1976, partial [Escherichia coli 5412]